MARLDRLPVFVEWHDAHALNSWTDPADIGDDPFVVQSVGFMIEGAKANHVVIAQSEGEDGELDGILSIPVGMVVRVISLGHPPQADTDSL